MQSKFTFSILLLLSAGYANAQTFTNGSLEAPTGAACTYIPDYQFPTFMGNTGYSFSTVEIQPGIHGKIYFADATCPEGTAQDGDNFLGLASRDDGSRDAMSLRLTAPLVANRTYTLTFYIKKPKTAPTIPLDIGYTTDSLAFGTLSGTVQAPASQSWTKQTVNIRPTVPTKFVTVRAVKGSSGTFNFSFTYVDNFSIVAATEVASPVRTFAVNPNPNPFGSSFSFRLDAGFALPGQLTLTDMTGRVVFQQSISKQEVRIPRGDMSAGIYLLSVKDVNGFTVNSKVVAD